MENGWPISNGVLAEIFLAKKADKKIVYFKVEKPHKILQIAPEEVSMEQEVEQFKTLVHS